MDAAEAIYDDADAFFEQALDIYVQIDDVEGQIVANLKVAMVHQRQSAFQQAEALCRKALTYAESHGLTPYRIDALQQLGNLQNYFAKHSLAIQLQEQALELSQQIGDKIQRKSGPSVFLVQCTLG